VLGGSLSRSAAISGDGGVIKMGRGTLSYDGTDANTYGGGTTVNAGVLQLKKPAGTNAVGNLTVNFGRVVLMGDEQIPDTPPSISMAEASSSSMEIMKRLVL